MGAAADSGELAGCLAAFTKPKGSVLSSDQYRKGGTSSKCFSAAGGGNKGSFRGCVANASGCSASDWLSDTYSGTVSSLFGSSAACATGESAALKLSKLS